MANDADWVADVRRWYFSSQRPAAAARVDEPESMDLGYEAAHPALEARHWPEEPRGSGFTDLK